MPGLGLQFDEPPPGVTKQVEAFVESYGGPMHLDAAGRIVWPAGDPPKGAPSEGLTVMPLDPEA